MTNVVNLGLLKTKKKVTMMLELKFDVTKAISSSMLLMSLSQVLWLL